MKIIWMHEYFDPASFRGRRTNILEEIVRPDFDSKYMQSFYERGFRIYDLTDINTGYNLGSDAVAHILNNIDIIFPDTSPPADELFIVKKLTTMKSLDAANHIFIKMKYGGLENVDIG